MSKIIVPFDDNLIVEIVEVEAKIGTFIIPDSAMEESTLARVIHPNPRSYNRDGSLRGQRSYFKEGDLVRIPKGKIGTGVPEAPDGKKWLAVPEDCIYYSIKEVDDEG